MLDEPPAPLPVYAITCKQCRHGNPSDQSFCESCGAPLKDDWFDMLHAPALIEGRKWMRIVAIMYLVSGLAMGAITWSINPQNALGLIVLNVALSATQGGLWWWAKRSVFPAAVVSLTLYLTVILVDAIADPSTLARGWLIKFFFISALAKAIQAGLAVKRLQAEATAPT